MKYYYICTFTYINIFKKTMESEKVINTFENGTYFNPAAKHYNYRSVDIICDRCKRRPLKVCIGWDRYDLCMNCIQELSILREKFPDTTAKATLMMQSQFLPATKMEQSQFTPTVVTRMEQSQFVPSTFPTRKCPTSRSYYPDNTSGFSLE